MQSHDDLHQLSQENKYRVLTTEPDSNTSSFPRTRPSNSCSYRQFHPSWLKQYPWLHYTDNPSNYRPISLLPVVSKLLEKHIYSIVFEHLAERKLLSVDQWGFCPGKSTVTVLTSTFHVFQLLEAGFHVSLVFFDLRKAFDSVPHLPLLQKLKDTDLNQHILQ